MQTTYANTTAVPLSIAVFLATDNYDHDATTISATSLIKPLRQIILATRVKPSEAVVDLIQMVASRVGTAIHDGIEHAWMTNAPGALRLLGYPKKVIDRVLINPRTVDLQDDSIPIYLERRSTKKVGKYIISGKFDFVGDGRVEDFKTTSVYTYLNNTNDDKYVLQGSIYRWLNPDIITQDEMAIQFIFTDWSSAQARAGGAYPPNRIHQKVFVLKPIKDTEAFITKKLALLDKYMDAPEELIPQCSDEDLWRSEPVWKYYKNADKLVRSTKNFDTKQEAYLRLSVEGGKGIVIERPGQVMACKYCPAFSACTQKDALIASGDLAM